MSDLRDKITEVWFAGDGNSHDTCYQLNHNGVDSITIDDKDWIVIHYNKSIRKVNPRNVTEIVWGEVGEHKS